MILRLLRGLVPEDRLTRRLAIQSIISAFGDGAFLTGSAFYFTQLVGLSAQHVGLGLSVAAAVQFLVSVPTGRWVDRVGAKHAWVGMAAAQAALYFLWPAINGFVTFLLMMAAMSVVESTMRAGRNAYQIAIFPREQRVASQAFMRAARNVGYTLGALLAGMALALDSDTAMELVPILTGALLVGNTVWVWRLPPLVVDVPEQPLEKALESAGQKGSALRNRGFLLMSIFNGVLSTHGVLLNTVIPLWLVEETDAPRVLLAWLFGTNTVMAVLLQVAAARGVTTVQQSLHAQYRGAACFVLSCGIVLVTHDTTGWITIVLVWLGHVTVTGSELFQSAGMWGLVAELSDPERLGDYQGVSSLGYTLGDVWAPALYTFLAMTLGAPGWIIIALIVVAAAVAIGPASRAAERHLAGGPVVTEADEVPHPAH
ncbi:MFS transporter [Nocardioides sp. CER19]|uniref:MFS transporter n=1 Tax=Nocardioides sp. CER19 TaxID=3038538 RepID=UPI0024485E64|nr:MFS transporter [Nocardioides sp. CER19]MDH2414271.1 MFS transporter [Nocardioides sp. CER19]